MLADRISSYLDDVEHQIHWKRAAPAVLSELQAHLCDQADAYIQQGMDDDAAQAEAVRQMGDAELVGRQLDLVHRPVPQRARMAFAGVLALIGVGLRLQTGSYSAFLVGFCLLTGVLLLTGFYLADYRVLAAHAGLWCLAGLAVPFLLAFLFQVGIRRALGAYLLCVHPVCFALGVYALRGHGRRGGLLCAAMAGVFTAGACWLHGFFGGIFVFLCAAASLLYALRAGWFTGPKWALAGYLLLVGAIVFTAMKPLYASQIAAFRLSFPTPDSDPFEAGWQIFRVRDALRSSAILGAGEANGALPEGHTDLILVTVSQRFGRIPYMFVCAALAASSVDMLLRSLSVKSQLGGILSLAASLSILLRMLCALAANAGILPPLNGCPFVSGNLASILDLALVGLILGILRQQHLPEWNSACKSATAAAV